MTIQKYWRRFSQHLKYQFDLSDIVFIQSLVRQRLAMKKVHSMRLNDIFAESGSSSPTSDPKTKLDRRKGEEVDNASFRPKVRIAYRINDFKENLFHL